jgi:Sec-independent protein translocase protein TatA
MKYTFNAAIIAMLSISLACIHAQDVKPAQSANQQPSTARAKTPTVQEQIDALRQLVQSLAGQMDEMKAAMAEKDLQLKKAEQAAANAQAAANRAEAETSAQRQAVTENTTAVSTLNSAVTDLNSSQSSLAATISNETNQIIKAIATPSNLHYKGITLAPYGFFNGETVYRTHATGGEMPTPWNSIPFEGADSYSMSETYLSGRQSRVGFIAEGKANWGTMRAYFEGDFLGVGTTSNDNQSTSYLFRQRIALAEAETNSHWTFSGGQGWTLATENKTGISTAAANMALPAMIDPNYVAGLVWARMGNLRLTKSFSKASFAASVENPQLLYTATLAGNTPYAVVGSAGLSAGLLNQTISACSPSTSIVNFANEAEKDANGIVVNVAIPVYKTVNSCANLANISFNKAPDLLVKAAFDPGLGHYEIFGIARFFHETIYPGETTNSQLYGGLKDIVTGLVVAPALTTAGATTNSITLGGVGSSMRIPIFNNKITFGAKALFGPGVGHFGASTLSDATSNANGALVPIHNVSGLLTAEATPTPRLQLYFYYGGDYAGREDEANSSATTLGTPSAAQSASGVWGGTWKAPSAAAVGYGSRLLSNAACTSSTAPGYNGSSTGYYAGASCGAQTRNVQEGTSGYWYDIYKGDRGRLRQGFQYSYAVREAWSGADGIGAKGIENMLFTSFRYFLP